MRNLKKHLLITAAALALLTAGAFAGNRAFAADEGPGRDYRASLIEADNRDVPPPPPEGFRPGDKRDRPCPPEFRHRPPRHEKYGDEKKYKKDHKEHRYHDNKDKHERHEKWEKHRKEHREYHE